MEPVMARKMWRTLEPYHGMIYFAPEATAAYEALGVMGFDGYFASRAAPMGAVPAEVVVATFFNFNPAIVHKAIPAAWQVTTPEQLVAARFEAAGKALRRAAGDLLDDPSVPRAAELARAASEGCTAAGRPLYAGHASLPWPDDPVLQLWHAISLLREFRGDGHVACLVEAGLDGIDALVFHAASGDVPRSALQGSRQWSDAAWDAAVAKLGSRGWVLPDGSFTEAGAALRQHIEDRTDALALPPWEALGEDGCDELRSLVRPLSKAVVAGGTFGLPR
ncbi:MAG: SCO6745 family protein, partial [Acidimicrobiales bacterium]